VEHWSYLALLGFVIFGSWWLEWAFRIRVLRNPRRLGLTLLVVFPVFVAWDAFAIAQGHWSFDSNQMTGTMGPFQVPLEEYLFFVIIPIAAILTWEGVHAFRTLLRRRRNP
jgi:lycopene cyclase domain-containing protein